MKNAALNYKITAYQRKRRVSNLKAAHLQQLKSTKLINAECILSVYKGGTIYRPTSFWHESSVISFSGNYFLRWAPNHPWVVELSACVQRKLVLNAQYRPKLSSLTTAPTDALNLQRTKLLQHTTLKGGERSSSAKTVPWGLSHCVLGYWHILPFYTRHHQGNRRCWSLEVTTEVVSKIDAVSRIPACCSPVGGVDLQRSHSLQT